jgi:hypothetical protein
MTDFDQIVSHIESQIPKSRPFVIVAESFGGPIAVKLLQKPLPVKACVFCATFIKAPRPLLLNLTRFLPLNSLLKLPLPKALIKWGLVGMPHKTPNNVIDLVGKTVKTLDSKQMVNRIKMLSKLDVEPLLKHLPQINYCYIKATKDKLVPANCVKPFEKEIKTLQVNEVEGGHFILQSNPQDCWAVIAPLLMDSPAL